MVNDDHKDPKTVILGILRASSHPVSGEEMGELIGISRVAIHKHIKTLKEKSYPISTNHQGYVLTGELEAPFTTWEFESDENIIVVEETGSTMDEAHRLATLHPGENFALAAERQSEGRGRRDRQWESPAGGLWVTRIIHPRVSAQYMQIHVMAAAAALASQLRSQYDIQAEVKWPNDVLVDGRKIAGILGEARVSGDRISYLALGLGLNVNNRALPGTTAIRELLGHDEDRRSLLRAWISSTDALIESETFRPGKKPGWWNQLMNGKGDTREFRVTGKVVRGQVKGCDSLGRLVLEKKNGRKIHLAPGEIDDTYESGNSGIN